MSRTATKTRFKAKLQRPAMPKRATWTFIILPKTASTKLPTRSMITVEGTINGHPFQSTLEPDGEGSHWLKVTRAMSNGSGATAGDVVRLEIAPVEKEPEPRVPSALRKALASNSPAKAVWADITTIARRDWIHWITSAKREETVQRRIHTACDMLASGKRRACCFDRSGIYSQGISAPQAAE